jgi:very-short-patch-repair endonuclease
LSELQNQAALKVKELEVATIDFIKSASWSTQRQRMFTRPEATRALHFWMDVLKGASGNGQRARYLRGEVRKQMSKCRESVPVWIMPLARLVQNFNPCESKFDVVIIDESSQSDLMSLMATYMAEKVIVVGDDEQVSPDGIGEQLTDIQDLIDAYLEDVPGSKLFDRKYSLYDLAKASFGKPIRLREHFRCAPEIIQFSNALSYEFEIEALRDMSKCSIGPPVVPYKVEGVRGNRKINVEEAEAIASLISAMCEMTEYADASIGVISLLGDEQARYIDRILSQRIPTEEYDRRRIVCGNAYQFQGDQRNVMFLSMVESPSDGPARLLSSGANDMYKKRFNVAASRAEDQMWVVYSLSPETDLKAGDLRKRLIDHALNPAVLLERINNQSKRAESEFERQVLTRLLAAGFQVTSQWAVGSYRIDLVVEGSGKRLAVECDGDRYHGADQLDNDIHRQQLLERLGWTFARIRGTEYFQSPEVALRPVIAKLAELGIEPTFNGISHKNQSSSIRERVIRRAAEIRTQWNEPKNEPTKGNTEAIPQGKTVLPPGSTGHESDWEQDEIGSESRLRSIGEVTAAEIRAAVRHSLQSGARDRDDLLHTVKLYLGFQRLRDRIKTRIIAAITAEVRAGTIVRVGHMLELCPPEFALRT